MKSFRQKSLYQAVIMVQIFGIKSGFGICVSLIFLVHIVASQNYCDPALCPNGVKHIGCNNNGAISPKCPQNAQIIKMVPGLRNFLVTMHNSRRYLAAGGRVEDFGPAIRMAKMQWNDELARLAELNVKKCYVQYDGCIKTETFPYSSQNIHIYGWDKSITYVPMDDVIVFAIKTWFDEEAKNATMAIINKFSKPSPGKDYRRFARIAQEKNTHVGCAIVRFPRGNKRWQLMTCNYAYGNVYNRPVYRAGPTASQCTTGVDEDDYTLCSVNEVYNVKSLNY